MILFCYFEAILTSVLAQNIDLRPGEELAVNVFFDQIGEFFASSSAEFMNQWINNYFFCYGLKVVRSAPHRVIVEKII